MCWAQIKCSAADPWIIYTVWRAMLFTYTFGCITSVQLLRSPAARGITRQRQEEQHASLASGHRGRDERWGICPLPNKIIDSRNPWKKRLLCILSCPSGWSKCFLLCWTLPMALMLWRELKASSAHNYKGTQLLKYGVNKLPTAWALYSPNCSSFTARLTL